MSCAGQGDDASDGLGEQDDDGEAHAPQPAPPGQTGGGRPGGGGGARVFQGQEGQRQHFVPHQ
eukprot:3901772-Pyramimonas_sp.AAC.1